MAKAEKTKASKSKVTNVLVVGVGGQGVIMVSKVLAELCQTQGFHVKQSEVHGMAKRGGVVFSHVRFGEKIYSPTIPAGEADVLLALEWAEGLRWLPYLNPESGIFISDTQQIVPPFACRSRLRGAEMAYSKETPRDVLKAVKTGYALDASQIAADIGEVRAANTVLLGILSTSLDFAPKDWEEIISRNVPPKTIEMNVKAFRAGRDWADKSSGDFTTEVDKKILQPQALLPTYEIQLDIERSWCKRCDICVKMCPERCLALDEEGIAVLRSPEACTGCRVCEWLCPDYAIAVKLKPKTVEGDVVHA
jgi:indolepyruvate ferredoxin oxidoreductase beta subunit